jgi:hypothetical protein
MDWRAIKIRELRDKLDQWAVFLYSWISLTRFFSDATFCSVNFLLRGFFCGAVLAD